MPGAVPEIRAGLCVRAALLVLRGYKLLISPLFTGSCRYWPSCADYTAEAIARHGVSAGVWLGGRRLARCQPFGGSGYDPVPHDHPWALFRQPSAQTETTDRRCSHGAVHEV